MSGESKKKMYRVGIVGLGKMGHIRAEIVRAHPLLQLEALCDVEEKKGRNRKIFFCKNYRDLLKRKLDIVFVCTFNNISPDIITNALDCGKHVFCEKPPGTSVADVQRIREAEQRNPACKLKFGFNHRYHLSVMEAKSLIENGRFGHILWMRGVYGKCGGINFENIWRSDKTKAGGGILLDQGIHMLDLFRYFCGEFDTVKSYITTAHWQIPVEDNAFAILRNQRNQIAMIHSSSTQWKHKFSLDICLEDGYICLNGILSSTRSYGDETLIYARKQFEDTTFAMGKPREEIIYFDRDDSWRLEIEEFVQAIQNNTPITSGNSTDAYEVMKLIELVYKESEKDT